MNIFFFTETDSGCYKWRAAIPAKYLRRRGHEVQIHSPQRHEGVTAPDVMVFSRTYAVDVDSLVDWCKLRGIRVVYDTDDALDRIPPENVNYRQIRAAMRRAEYLLQRADVVTTTTEVLAAHLRQWNPNVVVLPNSVDPEEWSVRPGSRGPIRVGWSGSATHFVDLSIALDAVADLQKQHGFTFVLQGITAAASPQAYYDHNDAVYGKRFRQSPIGRTFKRFLEKSSRLRLEFHPYVKVDRHADQVCDLALDIGIAPLVEDSFNQHKSCIKYYEYAMSGAVTLASRVLPYSTEVPLTCKNSYRHWTQSLATVLDADRRTALDEQRDWVMTHRNIETNVDLWESTYFPQLAADNARSLEASRAFFSQTLVS
jgi:O-antigen biosynthesis protein